MAKWPGQWRGRFLCGKRCVWLVLSADAVTWAADSGKDETTVPLHNLISAAPCDCASAKCSRAQQCFHCAVASRRSGHSAPPLRAAARRMRLHYAAPCGRHMWRMESRLFCPAGGESLEEWISAVQNKISELNRPKRLLIFINPYGGKKRAVKIYEREVLPILHLADVEAHAVVTQRQNHAKDMIEDMDISKFDGIVCVGGDGMFSEILNSVLLKAQREKGVSVDDMHGSPVVPRIPLGIVPAGSTNAAVNCITGSSDAVSATLLIVMGSCTGIDICGVYAAGRFLRFAVTFLAYGYFGDVIHDSEKLRWLGPKRYDYSGVKNILRRNLYEGELQLVVDDPSSEIVWKKDRCRVNCDTCSTDQRPDNSVTKIVSHHGRFVGINAAVVSCACHKSPKGISESQHLGNGYCDVIIVSTCSRLNYLRFLLRVANHHKDPFNLDFVQVHRVKEFSFFPRAKTLVKSEEPQRDVSEESSCNTSVWNCDGEIIMEPSISARVHRQLINVFGRGYEDRKTSSSSSYCLNCMSCTK